MNINYKEVGKRIKSRRKQLGLTQKQLAELVELSEGSVSRYESGSIKDAPTQKLNDFARALSIEVAWIIGFKPQTDKFQLANDLVNKIQELDDEKSIELINLFDKFVDLVKR